MKKLIVFIILLLLLFFFRENLNEYWIKHFSEKTHESSWLLSERNSLYDDLSGTDFSIAIESLTRFQTKIQNELNRVKSENGESTRGYRRNLVCELAAVYKKMAMQYLQNGEEEMYMKFIGKSQAELTECANLKSSL